MDTTAIVVLTCAVSNVLIATIAVCGNYFQTKRTLSTLETPVRERMPQGRIPRQRDLMHHRTDRLEDVDAGLGILGH